jgi:hypothetical protein
MPVHASASSSDPFRGSTAPGFRPIEPAEVAVWSLLIPAVLACDVMASPTGLEPATHSLGNCCSILLSYGDDVGQGTLTLRNSPAALCLLWLELRWAGEVSNSVPDRRGLNVSPDRTTVDLPEKRLDHRERPQRRTVVALTRLMLTEQHLNRRHVEEA